MDRALKIAFGIVVVAGTLLSIVDPQRVNHAPGECVRYSSFVNSCD